MSLRVAAKAPRAHVIVSEMMILAGELVGRFGAANDLPLPYRGQGDPVSVDVSGVPEGVPRAVLKRGGMRGASVGATPRRHGGLGVEAYVQFTSPIRRYLDVLAHAKGRDFPIKSGIMLGLGEEEEEIRQALRDLAAIGLDVLTLGQYLQPSSHYAPISRWATPEEFAQWKEEALEMGIQVVESGPLVRSSYHAEEQSARFAEDKRASA